ncbi:hypothetical protein PS623_04561 [Pseudomonas fluorescens]|nr:hypothetical protein [Pseudomonas fluorescens]VVN26499.1 hypothetical protein PS623_04561 [Pseudomonas fluorescens]
MKNTIKTIAAVAVAALLSVTVGCSSVPGAPVTDGSNMGWNAPNQNG